MQLVAYQLLTTKGYDHKTRVQEEPDVQLVSYQYNALTTIEHMEALPALAFLDCYSNRIASVAGIKGLTSLRVLMLGRNQLRDLSGATPVTIARVAMSGKATSDVWCLGVIQAQVWHQLCDLFGVPPVLAMIAREATSGKVNLGTVASAKFGKH